MSAPSTPVLVPSSVAPAPVASAARASGDRRRRSLHSPWLALGVLVAAVGIAALASVALGARVVGWEEIAAGFRHGFGRASAADSVGVAAVAERVPRTATALLTGAALGISGALMQAITRNPIADPGILGINTGASLAMVAAIAFAGISTMPEYLAVAMVGAALTAAFVYAIGSLGPGGATPVKLALAGVATTAALTSLINAIMLPRAAELNDFRFWQVGSVGRGTWASLGIIAPILALATLLAFTLATSLNSLALGEEMAVGLGVNVPRTRLLAAAAGVTLCAASTALVGPIGFVGLMVPHAVRMLTGPDHRWLLPLSALGGAALLTLSDVLGRIIARPAEVSVGVVTAFVGAPVLIAIARGAKARDL